MRLSRYLRTRERKKGLTAVFHVLHPDPYFVRTSAWEEFLHDPSRPFTGRQDLVRRGLLIEDPAEDDLAFAHAQALVSAKLSIPRILYLILAQGCNFACGYCPIPRLPEMERAGRLSCEDAEAGLDLWVQHLADANGPENYIIFYGGEPLLNKRVFFFCLEEIAKRKADGRLPVSTQLMLATNGSLMDEAVIEACLAHNVLVALGIDGPREQNNRLRVYADGQGTYDQIVKTLRELHERGVRTAVSASLTPYTLETLPTLTELLMELGVYKFGINFLKGRAVMELMPEQCARDTYLTREVEAVIGRYRATGDTSYEYQVERKWQAMVNRDFFPIDCTCYGNQLVIRADGGVSNCPFYDAKLGQVRSLPPTFRIADTSIVQGWRARSPLVHPAFEWEDGKALAGHGCAWSAIDAHGDAQHPDEAASQFSLALFELLIWHNAPREEGEE